MEFIIWKFCGLLIFIISFSEGTNIASNFTQIYVKLDSTLELKCNFGGEGDEPVTWKIGELTVAVGPVVLSVDKRIQVSDKEGLLKLRSIREDDEGTYMCHLGVGNANNSGQQKFEVNVEDPQYSCIPLTDIQDGQLFYSPPVENDRVVNGTEAYYECDEGFVLVGTNVSRCDADSGGWTAVPPYCINETVYSHSLTPSILSRLRLQKLGDEVEVLSKQQDEMQRKITKEVSHLRDNITSMADVSQTVTRAVESVVEKLLNRSVARTKLVDGRYVNEFVWHVKRIEKEMSRNKSTGQIQSSRFYARIPGYCMQMRIYPNNIPGYLGLYAGLVPGEFDDEMSWPFTGHYELAIISQNKNISNIVRSYSPLVNKGCVNETFFRPDPNNIQACGFQDMMSHKRLKDNPEYYLKDGSLVVRFRLY